MATHSFPVPTQLISICLLHSVRKTLNETTNSSEDIYMLAWLCILSAISKYQMGTPNLVRIALIMKEAWNPVCCHGKKLLSSYCVVQLEEPCCKESNISDTIWLKYLTSINLIKTGLSVWHHHLANLHILKAWISLEQKAIFENSKKHFSSHAAYLLMC